MKKHNLFIASCLTFILISPSMAEIQSIGSGPLHVQPAYTITRGQLMMGAHSRVFFKDEVLEREDGSSQGITYWDIQGGVGLYYGLTNHFQLGLSQIVYQDTHHDGNGYNLPDNLIFHAKLGSFGPDQGNMRFGAQLDVRLPLAENYNIPLEPYSAGRIGVGITGLFSIISEPMFPEYGININTNVGLYNHNDLGVILTDSEMDTITAQENTKEVIFGLGFSSRHQEITFFAELYGRAFLEKPPTTAYTRESSLYAAPGVGYALTPWMLIKATLDIRILGGDDETVYTYAQGDLLNTPWQHVPNLPSWRVNLSTSIALNPNVHRRTTNPDVQERIRAQTQLSPEVYEQLTDERRANEDAEAELERIRTERQRMEDLLDRLRNILENPVGSTPQNQDNENENSQSP